jgi:hypothetical protein
MESQIMASQIMDSHICVQKKAGCARRAAGLSLQRYCPPVLVGVAGSIVNIVIMPACKCSEM